MEWKLVDSSMIRSIAFEEDRRVLGIEFHSGGIYYFSDVPKSVHQGIMLASSKGSYFLNTVKGQYTFQRIR